MTTFTEIRSTKKKSSLVAQQILKTFNDGVYRSGDKLPPEREVADEMKVSRTCVREALKALEVLGLIESRVGDGTYVLPEATETTQVLRDLSAEQQKQDLLDVWEARAEIDAVIVKLAANVATNKAIERIQNCHQEMRSMVEAQDPLGYLELDRTFHLAVARAADNPLLEGMIRPLIRIANDSHRDYVPRFRLVKRLEVSYAEHARIVDAIERRDGAAGGAAARDHFEKIREFYSRSRL